PVSGGNGKDAGEGDVEVQMVGLAGLVAADGANGLGAGDLVAGGDGDAGEGGVAGVTASAVWKVVADDDGLAPVLGERAGVGHGPGGDGEDGPAAIGVPGGDVEVEVGPGVVVHLAAKGVEPGVAGGVRPFAGPVVEGGGALLFRADGEVEGEGEGGEERGVLGHGEAV